MSINLSDHFRENHIVIPWGCDYSWMNALSNYQETEALIDYIQKYMTVHNVSVVMSTPSDFLKAIQADNYHYKANESYPVFKGDMLPLSENKGNIWSGYFSQSPQIKQFVRDTSSLVHTYSKMFALKLLNHNTTEKETQFILKSKNKLLEVLGTINSGENIAG